MIEIKVINDNKKSYKRREDLKNTLRAKANKPITNKHDGRVATLPCGNVGKLSSDVALSKSLANGFSEAQHFAVASNIIELYENATLKEIQPNFKHDEPDTQIPRYIIDINLGGEKARALITLKETLYGMYQGNRLYSIELQEIEKLLS